MPRKRSNRKARQLLNTTDLPEMQQKKARRDVELDFRIARQLVEKDPNGLGRLLKPFGLHIITYTGGHT